MNTEQNRSAAATEPMAPQSITRPLNLRALLTCAPIKGFDFVPVLDLLLIALFLGLSSSRFVFAPGASVALPEMRNSSLGGLTPTAVLTVGRNDLVFFGGRKIPFAALEETLRRYMDQRADSAEPPVLLIKADASIDISGLARLFDLASRAGFVHVQLAAVPATASAEPFAAAQ